MPLITLGLPLMKRELMPQAESILVPIGLTAATSATDAAIQKNVFWSGTTALVTLNEEMKDTMTIVKSPEGLGSLIKGVSKTIKKEGKEQKGGFFAMLLGVLAARLLGNMLTDKLKIPGWGIIRASEVVWAGEGQDF